MSSSARSWAGRLPVAAEVDEEGAPAVPASASRFSGRTSTERSCAQPAPSGGPSSTSRIDCGAPSSAAGASRLLLLLGGSLAPCSRGRTAVLAAARVFASSITVFSSSESSWPAAGTSPRPRNTSLERRHLASSAFWSTPSLARARPAAAPGQAVRAKARRCLTAVALVDLPQRLQTAEAALTHRAWGRWWWRRHGAESWRSAAAGPTAAALALARRAAAAPRLRPEVETGSWEPDALGPSAAGGAARSSGS